MWRASLFLALATFACEFNAFRAGQLCDDETPCASGVCAQGLCREAVDMNAFDAALDGAVDAGRVIDARVLDARAPDARPILDMTPIVDARPPMQDAALDAQVRPPDMVAPEPEPMPEPLPEPMPEPEPEVFGFRGQECGEPNQLCVLVAADATIRLHEPEYRSGLAAGEALNLERDDDYDERGDVLLGFLLRREPLQGAETLELLLPRVGGPKRYPIPVNVAFVPTVWMEETVSWAFGLAREAGLPSDGVSDGDFVVFPLDAFRMRAVMDAGRFSIELTLRETGAFDFYSRETLDRPAARLRFTFRGE